VDGIDVNAFDASNTASGSILVSTDFKIGVDIPGQGDEFVGKMDDVRVYNRALSAAEVWQLYSATR
jgi:hypothetical protein